MDYILNIETSTKNCSVSVGMNGKVVSIVENTAVDFNHAEKLHQFINQALEESKIKFEDLKAIAVSKGPGSYTGLRIGVSAAKGFAYALNIPLIGIDTLLILAKKTKPISNSMIIPMLDARRMEVYTSVFNEKHEPVEKIKSLILSPEAFDHLEGKLYFIGDCIEKIQSVLKNKRYVFSTKNVYPSAMEMAFVSYQLFKDKKFENTAYFEPFYLKEFFTTQKNAH